MLQQQKFFWRSHAFFGGIVTMVEDYLKWNSIAYYFEFNWLQAMYIRLILYTIQHHKDRGSIHSLFSVKDKNTRQNYVNCHRYRYEPRIHKYSAVRPDAPGKWMSPVRTQHPSKMTISKYQNSGIFVNLSKCSPSISNDIRYYQNIWCDCFIYFHI